MKEQEFDSNSPKIFEASSVPAIQSTMIGTDFLNKSPAHIKERATNLGVTKFSTVNNSNSKIIDKNISTKKYFDFKLYFGTDEYHPHAFA